MFKNKRGFILLFSLLIITFISTVITVGLSRSMAELLSANRSSALNHAFHLAEAGIDAKLAELRDGALGNDRQNIPAQPVPGGTYGVVVNQLAGNRFALDATGTAGSTSRQVRLVVEQRQKLPIPGAVTVVGEGDTAVDPIFFYSVLAETAAFKGCDAVTGTCLPAITVTADRDYDALAGYINTMDSAEGYFGGRVTGAESDLGTRLPNGRYIIAGDYSIHKASSGERGDLGYDWLNDLAAWAKAQAQLPQNNCYFNRYNDDQPDPSIKQLTLQDRTLGTVSQPKICYAEYDFKKNADGTYAPPSSPDPAWDVNFNGLNNTGAGILVIKGEPEIAKQSRLTYNGIILVVGPSAELEIKGDAQVSGAVLMGTTAPYYESCTALPCDPNRPRGWVPDLDLEPVGSGMVRFSEEDVSRSLALLSDWTPAGWEIAGNTNVQLEMWQDSP